MKVSAIGGAEGQDFEIIDTKSNPDGSVTATICMHYQVPVPSVGVVFVLENNTAEDNIIKMFRKEDAREII